MRSWEEIVAVRACYRPAKPVRGGRYLGAETLTRYSVHQVPVGSPPVEPALRQDDCARDRVTWDRGGQDTQSWTTVTNVCRGDAK